MSARPAPAVAAAPLAALLSGLDAPVPSGLPGFLATLRGEAVERLRAQGLPGRKVEGWRFTPVASLGELEAVAAGAPDLARAEAFAASVLGGDALRLVVADGVPSIDVSAPLPQGVQTASLASLLRGDWAQLAPFLGAVAPREHFAALNAACFEDGLLLRVGPDAGVEQTLAIAHVATAERGAVSHPRVLVVVERGARLRFVETYLSMGAAPHLVNGVTEVHVGEGARVEHVRVAQGSDEGFHVATLAVRQGQGSTYRSHVFAAGGRLSRLDLSVLLAGEGAQCELDGVYHATGSEHVDHRLLVDHAAPGCTSHQRYRGIADQRGHTVFDGTSIVRRDAQRSSAHQENRNLLLGEDAVVHTKPHLEIDADDVSASHGAAVGALDEDQLFYLRARGIDEAHARDVLTFAFVEALVERIPDPPTVARLSALLLARMPHGDGVREMLA